MNSTSVDIQYSSVHLMTSMNESTVTPIVRSNIITDPTTNPQLNLFFIHAKNINPSIAFMNPPFSSLISFLYDPFKYKNTSAYVSK